MSHAGGEHIHIHAIFVIPVFCRGSLCIHCLSSSKRGRMLELKFWS